MKPQSIIRRAWALLAGLTLAFAGATVGSSTVSAHGFDDLEGQEIADPIDTTPAEALKFDAEVFAGASGLDFGLMAERLQYQEMVADLVGQLLKSGDRSFAGSALSWGTGSGEATLYFKGELSKSVEEILAVTSTPNVRVVAGQAFSLDELVALQDAITGAVIAQKLPLVYSAFDLESQIVELHMSGSGGSVDGLSLAETVEAESGIRVTEANYRVVSDKTPEFVPTHGYGGATMYAPADSCTSGFIVRHNSSGVEGPMTAAHCDTMTSMQDPVNGGTFSTSLIAEHLGWLGDIQWESSTHDDFPEFFANFSDRRAVTSRRMNWQLAQGQYVCRFGRSTGQGCGNVDQLNITIPGFADHLATVTNLTKLDGAGDSGGPWYSINTAVGIHSGHFNSPSGPSVFSKLENAENALTVTTETS